MVDFSRGPMLYGAIGGGAVLLLLFLCCCCCCRRQKKIHEPCVTPNHPSVEANPKHHYALDMDAVMLTSPAALRTQPPRKSLTGTDTEAYVAMITSPVPPPLSRDARLTSTDTEAYVTMITSPVPPPSSRAARKSKVSLEERKSTLAREERKSTTVRDPELFSTMRASEAHATVDASFINELEIDQGPTGTTSPVSDPWSRRSSSLHNSPPRKESESSRSSRMRKSLSRSDSPPHMSFSGTESSPRNSVDPDETSPCSITNRWDSFENECASRISYDLDELTPREISYACGSSPRTSTSENESLPRSSYDCDEIFPCKSSIAVESQPRKSLSARDSPARDSPSPGASHSRKSSSVYDSPPRKCSRAQESLPRKSSSAHESRPRKNSSARESPPRKSSSAVESPPRKSSSVLESPPRKSSSVVESPPRKSSSARDSPPRKNSGSHETASRRKSSHTKGKASFMQPIAVKAHPVPLQLEEFEVMPTSPVMRASHRRSFSRDPPPEPPVPTSPSLQRKPSVVGLAATDIEFYTAIPPSPIRPSQRLSKTEIEDNSVSTPYTPRTPRRKKSVTFEMPEDDSTPEVVQSLTPKGLKSSLVSNRFSTSTDPLAIAEDPVVVASRLPFETIKSDELVSKDSVGEIYRGSYRDSIVSIKRLLPETRRDVNKIGLFLQEVKLLAAMDHPHIVTFIGVAWDSFSDVCIVTEFMDGGDLRSALDHFNRIGRPLGFDKQKATIARHVAHALAYLHSLPRTVLYRDIKSRNILLDADHTIAKLTNCSVSKEWQDGTMSAGVGTMLWMAPEVMTGDKYDDKADVYSFGILLSELDTYLLPYTDITTDSGENESDRGRVVASTALLHRIVAGTTRVAFSKQLRADVRVLGESCVRLDPTKRPSSAEVLYELQKIERTMESEISIVL